MQTSCPRSAAKPVRTADPDFEHIRRHQRSCSDVRPSASGEQSSAAAGAPSTHASSKPASSRTRLAALDVGMWRLFVICLIATAAAGQEQPVDSQQDTAHIMGVIPSHGVTNDKNAAPLPASGKFRIFTANVTDPFSVLGVGLQAGIGQARNDHPDYGQGSSGYAKRLGAAYSDFAISNFMSDYVFPSLLREDPRYFREGSGSFKKRLGHALASPFVTRTDAGKWTFNYSNTLGAVTAGAISNLYYPSSDRDVGLVFSRAGIGILFGAAGAILSEFGPDIGRKLSRKPKQKVPKNRDAP